MNEEHVQDTNHDSLDDEIDQLLDEAFVGAETRHPLDVEPVEDLDLGWIDRYTALFTELNGSPRSFNLLTGAVLVATATRRLAKIPMSFGDIFPNIYASLVAASTVYRKSTTIRRARPILYHASLDELLFSENFTSEGLINGLAESPSILIVRDEIGTLMGSQKVKYLATLTQDLTALYDCGSYSRKLAGTEAKVDEPFVNILGATTPTRFFESVRHSDWEDGFLVRWLFITPEEEPRFSHRAGLLTFEQENEIRKLGESLYDLVNHPAAAFRVDQDALQLWDGWQERNLRNAFAFQSGVVTSLVGRYNTYALKFAIILAVAHGRWGHIDVGIMQTAIQLAENYKAHVYRLMQQKDRQAITGGKLQKILGVLHRRNQKEGGPVPIGTIYRYANLKKDEVEPVVEELIERGAVMVDMSGSTPRYEALIDRLSVRSA